MNEAVTERYLELWGDTVDSAHAAASVGIGVVLGTTGFLVSRWGFGHTAVAPALAKSYALLIGLACCMVAGVICGRLFAPKRVVTLEESGGRDREEALAAIEAEVGPLDHPSRLDPPVRRELEELGLYDVLAERAEAAGHRGEHGEGVA